MATEYKNGLMVLNTKDNGKIIEPMEKVNLSISMATFTTENGLTIRPTAMECTIILMVPCTKATGETTSNMARAKNPGPMAQFMPGFIWQERNME